MERFLPPEAKRVLVLSPHPDDEAIGCGGTIALYAKGGANLCLAIVTNGEKLYNGTVKEKEYDIAKLRQREAIESSRILGIEDTVFLGFPDGELRSYGEEIKNRIKGLILDFKPDIILCPSPIDYHNDHIEVAKAVVFLSNIIPELNIMFYNVYACPRFNTLVDITDVLRVKEKAIECYYYSLFKSPEFFAESVKGINRFLAFYTQQRRYYEGFYLKSSVELNDVLQWYAYENFDTPEMWYLSKLKITDELLKELRILEESLSKRLKEKDNIIIEKDLKILELQEQLNCITQSLPWKLARRYYLVRDRIFPTQTYRRKIYDSAVSFLRSKIK